LHSDSSDSDGTLSFKTLNALVVKENEGEYKPTPEHKRGFKDLAVCKASVELTAMIYALTRAFPRDEVYGSSRQLRDAAISVNLNIAEGWGRNRKTEMARFCEIARGSLAEVDAALDVARVLGFVAAEDLGPVHGKLNAVGRMLKRMIEALRN